jgi:phosphate acetyltransferase
MVVPDKKFGEKGAMIYSDCGVVINPDSAALAEIAGRISDSCRALLQGRTPRRDAFVSRQKEVGKDPSVDKVVEAVKTDACPFARA